MNHLRSYIGKPVDELPSPSLIIERATLLRNVAEMAAHTDNLGVQLRPHWKTTKSAQVAQLQLKNGAVGLTAATAAEVTALADAGVDDIFWAYPPIGAHRVDVALNVAQRARLIVGVDSVAAVRPLAVAVNNLRGRPIDVRLEVDTGLGRMGVRPDDAVSAARRISGTPGVRLEGIFTHEGNVQGIGADAEKRSQVGVDVGRLLVEVAEAIREAGMPVGSVSVGSTAGARSAPTVPGITEARPGTYAYGDENQVAIGTIAPEDAAITVLSRVISVQRGTPVLIDAGIKAMSSDGSTHGDGRIGTIVSEAGGVVARAHEEHGFVTGATPLAVGDVLRIRPNHACGLTNMHSHAFVADEGTVTDVWPVLARH